MKKSDIAMIVATRVPALGKLAVWACVRVGLLSSSQLTVYGLLPSGREFRSAPPGYSTGSVTATRWSWAVVHDPEGRGAR
jgi:hypothetical protein